MKLITGLLMSGCLVTTAPAQSQPAASAREQNLKQVGQAYTAESNTDTVHVWPAVLADREKGFVEILAESTGMQVGEPVEFLLITPESGHDYEAFAISFARAADIRSALEFIGVPAGEPADYSAFRMWPQGERVIIEVTQNSSPITSPAPADTDWIRAEDYILGPEGKTIPRDGFVFTGSFYTPDGQLAPDVDTPHSIAAFYNEPQTVFDVPRIAPQGAVYGRTEINPANQPEAGALLRLRFRHDGAPLPRAIKLDITIARGSEDADGLNRYTFSCRKGNSTLLTNASLNQLLALFRKYQKQQHDIYIAVTPNPGLSIGQHKEIFTFFETINKPDGARLIAAENQKLYYKAFLPDMRFRDRDNRPGQPWELYLSKNAENKVTGTLIHVEETWDSNNESSFNETTYSVQSPDELPELIAKHPETFKVVFFFCSDDLALQKVMPWYSVLYPEYKTVYFYLPDSTGPRTQQTKTKESDDER